MTPVAAIFTLCAPALLILILTIGRITGKRFREIDARLDKIEKELFDGRERNVL